MQSKTFRNYIFISSMRPFRKAKKASCKVSYHSFVAVCIHGNLKAFLVFLVTGFFIIVPFVTGWTSRLGRFWYKGTLSVPTAWGKCKALCIIRRAEGASVAPFPSLCLMLLGIFLISALSHVYVIGGAGHVLAVLDFHFLGRKRKVVKCSWNVLETVSQWRGIFDLFITGSPFPSFLSQSSVF